MKLLVSATIILWFHTFHDHPLIVFHTGPALPGFFVALAAGKRIDYVKKSRAWTKIENRTSMKWNARIMSHLTWSIFGHPLLSGINQFPPSSSLRDNEPESRRVRYEMRSMDRSVVLWMGECSSHSLWYREQCSHEHSLIFYMEVVWNGYTVLVLWMAHRIWKETKQEPCTAGPGNMFGCCLVSFHFLWAILSTSTVNNTSSVSVGLFDL